jgi:3-hydroxyisobutyrate dehydrogenase
MGLGLMGAGMARNLLAKGFQVSVYNRNPAKSEPFAESGARVAGSPREAAEGAEFVISMVADDAASRAVWLGENGALAAMARGSVAIESGTVTVGWIRELSAAAAERGIEVIDAPVTGSRIQADAGQLLFLMGGSEAALERARPVLAAMSRDIVHVGPSGSGTLLKLVNNFLCGVQAASLAEAIGMLEHGGLDRRKALDVLTAGAPGSPLVKTLVGRIESGDYSPHFAVQLMRKDLTYAHKEAGGYGVALRTAEAAREVFGSAVEKGLGEKDISSVVEQFR